MKDLSLQYNRNYLLTFDVQGLNWLESSFIFKKEKKVEWCIELSKDCLHSSYKIILYKLHQLYYRPISLVVTRYRINPNVRKIKLTDFVYLLSLSSKWLYQKYLQHMGLFVIPIHTWPVSYVLTRPLWDITKYKQGFEIAERNFIHSLVWKQFLAQVYVVILSVEYIQNSEWDLYLQDQIIDNIFWNS